LLIGLCAGVVCFLMVTKIKGKFGYDDALDAFGVHGAGGTLGAILTGVFAAGAMFKAASGSPLPLDNPGGWLVDGNFRQVGIQLVAALAAAAFAFAATLVLVKIIDVTWGFCLDSASEGEGLDRNQHGEVGFDLGLALELISERPPHEPRAASVPPNGVGRFSVVVEGGQNGDLIATWSKLCQSGPEPPAPEFLAVYPFMTTVQGNRFRFRGGDPAAVQNNLVRLLQSRLNRTIHARVEK